MRVWLDDIRPMQEEFDVHAKNAGEAIKHLLTKKVTFISLDHDLAEEHYSGPGYSGYSIIPTGYTVACFIEEQVELGKIPMPEWTCHSQNPVGKQNIEMAMRSAERLEKSK